MRDKVTVEQALKYPDVMELIDTLFDADFNIKWEGVFNEISHN